MWHLTGRRRHIRAVYGFCARVEIVCAQRNFPRRTVCKLETVPPTPNALHPLAGVPAGRLAAADAHVLSTDIRGEQVRVGQESV